MNITLKSYEAWISVGGCPTSCNLLFPSKLHNELAVNMQHHYKVCWTYFQPHS